MDQVPTVPEPKDEARIADIGGCREALERIKSELGFLLNKEYPASVTLAWDIADAALRGHRFAPGDEKHSSRNATA